MKILIAILIFIISFRSFAGFHGSWSNGSLSRVYQCQNTENNSISVKIDQNFHYFQIKNLVVKCGEKSLYEKSLARLEIKKNELLHKGKVVGKILNNSFYLILPDKNHKLIVRGDRRDRELSVYVSDFIDNKSFINVLAHLERQL